MSESSKKSSTLEQESQVVGKPSKSPICGLVSLIKKTELTLVINHIV